MEDTIRQLNSVIDDLLKTDLKSINWSYKPAPDKWSKKEIIGHLIDSAQKIFSVLYDAPMKKTLSWYMNR
ncbi:MAG: hypothetical protein JWR12_672 [Mucilaginibacter sp.]|nr:hypothetical protein [Mucilaginibacter sp.]